MGRSSLIGNFLPLVGGSEYCDCILEVLEKLCTMQEVTVREAVGMASHVTCDCDL